MKQNFIKCLNMKTKKAKKILNELANDIYLKINFKNKAYSNNFLNLYKQIKEINKIDTKNIKPLFRLFSKNFSVCFNDEEIQNLPKKDILKNCTHHNDEYVFLNKVVDKNDRL